RIGSLIVAIALPTRPNARRTFSVDLSAPILVALTALLCVLVVLPVTWLVYYSLTVGQPAAAARSFTLVHFQALLTDPDFTAPLITTVVLAVGPPPACCATAAPMAWLVARTDLPMSGVIRALVTASFVTPPFLGAVAWEILAAPNSGLLNQLYRLV